MLCLRARRQSMPWLRARRQSMPWLRARRQQIPRLRALRPKPSTRAMWWRKVALVRYCRCAGTNDWLRESAHRMCAPAGL
jgi:hypothetical protein